MKKRQSARKSRPAIDAKDLFRLRVVTGLAMAPDEKRIAYSIERTDEADNKYYSNIHMLDITTGSTAAFTHGKHNDLTPAWSHDGKHLAFVSRRDKKTGLYLMPSDGGAERRLIEIEGSIDALQFTPDDRHLVFSLQYADAHFIEDEKKKKEPPVYRHITRLSFRMDGAGYIPTHPMQIYTLDIATGNLRQITRGKHDNVMPHISPNGQWITYVSNRSKDPDLNQLRMDLFVIPFKGGKERKVPTPTGPVYGPTFSPDSKNIAYLGHDNPVDAWGVTNMHIWKVGINGTPAARDLMPGFDRMTMDQSISDTDDAHGAAIVHWSADGRRIFFLSSDTGATNLFSIPAGGGKPTRLFKGNCHIKAVSFNGHTRTAALIHASLENPGEIVTCPTTWNAEKKAVFHVNPNVFLRTDVQLGKTREVWFKSFDGTEIQGWLVTPPGFKPGRKYPAILEIHGGPRVQYAYTFFHEMQYLAARGYVVFYTNPRGGSGRGATWAQSIVGAWGTLDYQDCMAAADWLERQKFVNAKRTGVTGGSYGGYMTNWIIGHTNRFKAAVTQRSVVDLRSFVGSSDIGYGLRREFLDWPWDNPEVYRKHSPLTYFENARTPVLIIHSERDLRCSIEQAEQMFVKLKSLGKKVEMVRFPDESHGLSRHGRPDRRLARLEWIVKWFDRHLKR